MDIHLAPINIVLSSRSSNLKWSLLLPKNVGNFPLSAKIRNDENVNNYTPKNKINKIKCYINSQTLKNRIL